jgi:hypothetical protein
VFTALDSDQSGFVNDEDLFAAYDASRHPSVVAGILTRQEACREFTTEFVTTVDSAERDGRVSLEEFEQYYSTVGAFIDTDERFQQLMRLTWGNAVGSKKNGSANRADQKYAWGSKQQHHQQQQQECVDEQNRAARRKVLGLQEGDRATIGAERTNLARGKERADRHDRQQKAAQVRVQRWGTVGGRQRRGYLSSGC